jgi:hypothetical protein
LPSCKPSMTDIALETSNNYFKAILFFIPLLA